MYEPRHKVRLAIKPGITGMWQVSGRSDITDFEEVVRLDKEYIENWDIGLDIKILLKYWIIDGVSKDHTMELVKKYAQKYSFIKYSSEPDRGISDAFNKGIGKATGELIGLINSDDQLKKKDKSVVNVHTDGFLLPLFILLMSKIYRKHSYYLTVHMMKYNSKCRFHDVTH